MMKLFDKIKDLFMDEVAEDDEIEIEEEEEEIKEKFEELPKPKEEKPTLPKVMRETIKEEKTEPIRERKTFVDPDEFMYELEKQEKKKEEPKLEAQPKKFAFPIDIEEMVPTRDSKPKEQLISPVNTVVERKNINVLDIQRESAKKVPELYPSKEEPREKPKFKATPVISPVYGILDKNYKKEEVRERDGENNLMKRPSKKVDFETVRKKAFGNLADEIKDNLLCENCELYKEVKKISALSEDDLLYDMTVDPEEEKEITIAKAYDNYEEFGVAYEPKVEKRTTNIHIEEEFATEPTESVNKVEEDKTNLDDIINNSQKIDPAIINDHDSEDEVVVSDKPDVTYDSKIDDEKSFADIKEEVPTRSEKKKETKVDADFFELIDSMYKERTDD